MLDIAHQSSVGKAPIGQKYDLSDAVERQQVGGLGQQRLIRAEGHTATPVFDHLPHQRNRPPPIDNRRPDDTNCGEFRSTLRGIYAATNSVSVQS